jgi:hypothetical protein
MEYLIMTAFFFIKKRGSKLMRCFEKGKAKGGRWASHDGRTAQNAMDSYSVKKKKRFRKQ